MATCSWPRMGLLHLQPHLPCKLLPSSVPWSISRATFSLALPQACETVDVSSKSISPDVTWQIHTGNPLVVQWQPCSTRGCPSAAILSSWGKSITGKHPQPEKAATNPLPCRYRDGRLFKNLWDVLSFKVWKRHFLVSPGPVLTFLCDCFWHLLLQQLWRWLSVRLCLLCSLAGFLTFTCYERNRFQFLIKEDA